MLSTQGCALAGMLALASDGRGCSLGDLGSLSPLDRAIELVESWPLLADLLALYCRVLVPGLGTSLLPKQYVTHV
jgi:hypothetical protein